MNLIRTPLNRTYHVPFGQGPITDCYHFESADPDLGQSGQILENEDVVVVSTLPVDSATLVATIWF